MRPVLSALPAPSAFARPGLGLGLTAAPPSFYLARRHLAQPARGHHFDTLRVVQVLRREGLSEKQSVAVMRALEEAVADSVRTLARTAVPREEQEKSMYTQKVDLAKLRAELLAAADGGSAGAGATAAVYERLENEVAKTNGRLRDDLNRIQASFRLDLNLEKGRTREEARAQKMKLREMEVRIEQEAAAVRERLEAVKFSTLQWFMGVATGTAALLLGAWRLLM